MIIIPHLKNLKRDMGGYNLGTNMDSHINTPAFSLFNVEYNLLIAEELLRLRLSQMIINEKIKNKEFKIPIHLALGHEAIAFSVEASMEPADQLVLPHRNLHYNLAREKSLKPIVEEFLLKETGLAKSQLGSMNLANKEKGIVYTSSILGNNLSVATGLALGKKVRKENGIVLVVLGDGAMEEGSLYENLVFLRSNQLPSLVIIENNQWSLATKIEERRCGIDLKKFADSLGIKFEKLVGNDPYQYFSRLKELKEYSMSNNLPVCIEVELATLGYWHVNTEGYAPPGRFINYHAGAAPTVNLLEWPLIEESTDDPLFVLKKYFDENQLRKISAKVLLSLQEELL